MSPGIRDNLPIVFDFKTRQLTQNAENGSAVLIALIRNYCKLPYSVFCCCCAFHVVYGLNYRWNALVKILVEESKAETPAPVCRWGSFVTTNVNVAGGFHAQTSQEKVCCHK